ncbi:MULTISPECIES: hypothetical protein [unclassified Carboxylicivirga]|uniref:hypothetical protein n=1 Tax=Carboxylicivirga TaxID=1628153 RepID=UPI003D335482
MKTKFKIGDKVAYMSNNRICEKEILGIVSIEGAVKNSWLENKSNESRVQYQFGPYDYTDEENVHASIDELKKHLFANIQS